MSANTNPQRPPRRDAVLKNLPEERQAEVIELLKEKGIVKTRAHLADDGIKTSMGALSGFWRWWELREQFRQNESDVEQFLEKLRREEPQLSEDKLYALGQQAFSLLAIRGQDPKDWARVQLVRQRQAKIGLEGERNKVLERRAVTAERALKLAQDKHEMETSAKLLDKALRQKADEINASPMSNAEKIAAMRREAFKVVDDLQKSGKVKIPKS